jgi:hypothetical protein
MPGEEVVASQSSIDVTPGASLIAALKDFSRSRFHLKQWNVRMMLRIVVHPWCGGLLLSNARDSIIVNSITHG